MGMAGAAVAMTALSPISLYTVGRAWNHDAAVAMFLLALVISDSGGGQARGWRMLAAGLACGLAVGTRLSFAPAAVGLALLIIVWMRRESRKMRARALGLFALGAALGLLPTLVLALRAPDAFVFGNLTYAKLNEAYRAATGYTTAMDLAGKARFILHEILLDPRNAILFVSLVVLLAAEAVRVFLSRGEVERQPLSIGLLLPLLLLGALAPTPSWYQYFYLLVPFAAVAAAMAAARLRTSGEKIPVGAAWMILATIGVAWFSRGEIGAIRRLRTPQSWTPSVVRQIGARIVSLTGGGPVLTLSPIYPLEGGSPIYEQSSGPSPGGWGPSYLHGNARACTWSRRTSWKAY
jgi:4-amino-4-deoxy-L-arabinose transferase-like glycosyltransferase